MPHRLSRTAEQDLINIYAPSLRMFGEAQANRYQDASNKHLHRYLAEFASRYSNRAALCVDDTTRAVTALQGVVGKRLTYKLPDGGNRAQV